MTNQQLYLAIGIPMVFSALNVVAVFIGILTNNRQLDSFRREMDSRFESLRSEIQRVEGVLVAKIDALTLRVKALEDETHARVVR